MEIKQYEEKLLSELEKVVSEIIKEKTKLNIPVQKGERVGDTISKSLEKKFVDKTKKHSNFSDAEPSPRGKTKNPWDVKTNYTIQNFKQEIWIDFKAVNIDNDDSNPDSGIPDKIIDHILNDNFYLVFVYVYYKGSNRGLEFVKKKGKFIKLYFLKDISPTFRITPANQMQVNYSAEPVYRTREQFLKLLLEKKIQSNERNLKKASQKLENLKAGIFKKIKKKDIKFDELSAINKKQEDCIKKLK